MSAADKPEARRGPARRARGKPYKTVADARSAGMLGVGMIIGAVLGAGVALLVAPQAGWETRRSLTSRARRIRGETHAWTRLGRELKRAARAKRQAMELAAKRHEIEARRAAAGDAV
jgi:gas vesicle protein